MPHLYISELLNRYESEIKHKLDFAKTILLTSEALINLGPPDLSDPLLLDQPSRSLQYQEQNLLSHQSYKLKAHGVGTFACAAP